MKLIVEWNECEGITTHLGLGNVDGLLTVFLWWRDNKENTLYTKKGMARVHKKGLGR